MTKTYCDFCGEVITEATYPGRWPKVLLEGVVTCVVPWAGGRTISQPDQVTADNQWSRADICRSCTAKLWRASADALLAEEQ